MDLAPCLAVRNAQTRLDDRIHATRECETEFRIILCLAQGEYVDPCHCRQVYDNTPIVPWIIPSARTPGSAIAAIASSFVDSYAGDKIEPCRSIEILEAAIASFTYELGGEEG